MSRSRRRYSRPARDGDGHWGWRRWLVGLLVLLTASFCGWWWFFQRLQPSAAKPTSAVPLPETPGAANRAPIVGEVPVPRETNQPGNLPPPAPPTNQLTSRRSPPEVLPIPPVVVPEETPAPPSDRGPDKAPHPASDWLLAQLALVSRGISPGSIDGVGGAQSREALRAFQADNGLEASGQLDRDTRQALRIAGPAFSEYLVTRADLDRLSPVPTTWVGKAAARRLDYESLAEMIAEQTQCHPAFLRRLNPSVDWAKVSPGTRLNVLNARFPPPRRAALVRISLASKWLRAFDDRGRLLAHFPCSIAASVQKRPVGILAVATIVKDPNYTMDPAVFPESAEARALNRKLVLSPGPNNPVGLAWIGLNRPRYGIHGTPHPEQVGRTESHGCFRLANWNADYLRQMCWVGLQVSIDR